jgi:hypothetical protein
MLPLTIFLAKYLGLFCIVVAVAMMVRKDQTVATVNALVGNASLVLIVGLLGLAAGLGIIVGHNIWSGGALPVVVTLMGWILAIRGAGLIVLSSTATIKLIKTIRFEALFYGYMGATLILGLYLTYAGFSA